MRGDFCELPDGCFQNLIPIGDWGAGWGPLCIDLSKPESEVDKDNEETWSLQNRDEWYFCGALEEEYEQENEEKPTYEWYQNL